MTCSIVCTVYDPGKVAKTKQHIFSEIQYFSSNQVIHIYSTEAKKRIDMYSSVIRNVSCSFMASPQKMYGKSFSDDN